MCEFDKDGEFYAVRLQLDLLHQAIMRSKHYQYEGEHPLDSETFRAKFDEVIRARDKWLITRNKEDGDAVKELAKLAAGLSTAGQIKPHENAVA